MNILKIISVFLLVFLVIAILIVFVFPRFESTAWITPKVMELKDQAVTYVSNNAALVAGSIGTIVTIGGAAASKISSVKQQAQTAIDTTKTEAAANLQQEKDALTSKMSSQTQSYEAQITDLKGQLTTAQNANSNTDSTINNLKGQVQSVQEQNSNFVKGLLTAANGALVTNGVDGKTYSVLKVPPEIHIK